MNLRKLSSGESHTFDFTEGEIRSMFDDRGKFHLGDLRRLQAEKALQIVLFDCHNIVTKRPEEVRQHVMISYFSLVKSRLVRWGYYLLTIEYVYQGTGWQHVFRFVRSSNGGLNGHLYFNSRRRLYAK